MKRILVALIAAVGLASSAGAASLSLQLAPGDTGSYAPGETITLELFGSTVGGEVAYGIDVRTVTDDLSVLTWNGAVQAPTPFTAYGVVPWTMFPTICPSTVDASECVAVSQANSVAGPPAQPVNAVPLTLLATITATAGAAGTANVSILPAAFFGSPTVGPGLVITVIPEPGTLLLLGAGLGGLMLLGRRR